MSVHILIYVGVAVVAMETQLLPHSLSPAVPGQVGRGVRASVPACPAGAVEARGVRWVPRTARPSSRSLTFLSTRLVVS